MRSTWRRELLAEAGISFKDVSEEATGGSSCTLSVSARNQQRGDVRISNVLLCQSLKAATGSAAAKRGAHMNQDDWL